MKIMKIALHPVQLLLTCYGPMGRTSRGQRKPCPTVEGKDKIGNQ